METPDAPRPEPGLTPDRAAETRGADAPRAPDAAEEAAGLRAWLVQNGLTLAIVAAVAAFVYVRFKPDNPLAIVAAALGLGMLIFIHELGHFLAAKWCDVHVETFSVGFGPPLPGCHFQWGETTYMLALVPLGGYVKMVGEGSDGDDGEDDPRSFKNKTVGQRMLIISAGVVMNLILGALCFVFVFMTKGVKENPPVIGTVNPGSPAWEKGLRTGMRIAQVGSKTSPAFGDMQNEVLRSASGQKIPLQVVAYSGETAGEPQDVLIEPRRVADSPLPVFGVTNAPGTPVVGQNRRRPPTPFALGSAAAKAEPPLVPGDRVVASSSDPNDIEKLVPLPPDPRAPETGNLDMFELIRRFHRLAGKPMKIQVARDVAPAPLTIALPPAYKHTLGMRMRMGRVAAVREKSPASRAGVRPRDPADPEAKGDLIKAVEVKKPDGSLLRYVKSPAARPPAGVEERELDPARLPDDLIAWAATRGDKNDEVKLTVLRTEGHMADGKEEVLGLTWDDTWRYAEETPLDPTSPVSLPCLGLAYRVESVVEEVRPGSPAAEAGIKPSDVVTDVLPFGVDADGNAQPNRWVKLEGPDHSADRWGWVALRLLQDMESKRFKLKVAGRPEELELTAAPDKDWPAADRGILFEGDIRYKKARGVGEALWMAVMLEANIAEQIYQSLKALATGRVSPLNLHGPLSIAGASYTIANYDIYEFVRFLGIISINLAIINFLPIPVLDGGHMVFLIYEKLAGRPPSEGVRIGATFGGLAFIAGLMLFVFGLDVVRIFF